MRAHVNAFSFFSGVTKEILYDNTKSVTLKQFFERVEMNPRFSDMAAHYGFTPRLCKPYRAQTKGKVESGVKYVKGNFLLGEVFSSLDEINAAAHTWLNTVANTRIHSTTGEVPKERFLKEDLMPIASVAPFDTSEQTFRRVTLDCLISHKGCRYSVPHHAAGKVVLVKEGEVIRIFLDGEHLTSHQSSSKGRTIIIEGSLPGNRNAAA